MRGDITVSHDLCVTGGIAIGHSMYPQHCICVGENTVSKEDYDVIIGEETDQGSIKIRDVDIRALVKRVEELEKIVEKQQSFLEKLWYAPGNPGFQEAAEMWTSDVTKK